jgi:ABC-type Na+ efflux pump permease subunit
MRYSVAVLVPYAVILTIVVAVATAGGEDVLNGAESGRAFGLRYGASSDSIAIGMLLILVPGLIAVLGASGVAGTVRNVVGAEAGRGGLEALLAAPYTPASIAASLLGYAIAVATALWAVMTALGGVAIAVVAGVHHERLHLDAAYVAMAVGLPLLSCWAAAGLALLVNLLFPRLAQAGTWGMAGAGNNLGLAVGVLPGVGALLGISFGAVELGALRVFLIGGAITAAIAVPGVVGVAYGFRPDTALDS